MTASFIGVPGIAFGAVFGLFVVAFAVLVVVTIRWAVRRDRQGRAQWLARRRDAEGGPDRPPGADRGAAVTDGHHPAVARGRGSGKGGGGTGGRGAGPASAPDDPGSAR